MDAPAFCPSTRESENGAAGVWSVIGCDEMGSGAAGPRNEAISPPIFRLRNFFYRDFAVSEWL
jgi:hypothetical protein